jgi:hypothetical protein
MSVTEQPPTAPETDTPAPTAGRVGTVAPALNVHFPHARRT